ncbi:MAG: 50S ribosomal protein L9 [Candidatus Neomarinimicrobiota bacterium]|nr:50S ribosomal protein L9 [Candidatus Neomarinimicrobiota bacterium]
MEIILNKSLENVGEEGDVVSVKDGYARNYLIPNGFAKNATKKNILAIQKEIKNREIQEAKNRQNLEALNKQLNKLSLKFELKAGEDEKLFGSVTSQMISEAIAEQGFTVDKKEIEIPDPIKSLGKFVVFVRLGPELEAKIKIKVSAEK